MPRLCLLTQLKGGAGGAEEGGRGGDLATRLAGCPPQERRDYVIREGGGVGGG